MKYFHELWEEVRNCENPNTVFTYTSKIEQPINEEDSEETNRKEVGNTIFRSTAILFEGIYTIFS